MALVGVGPVMKDNSMGYEGATVEVEWPGHINERPNLEVIFPKELYPLQNADELVAHRASIRLQVHLIFGAAPFAWKGCIFQELWGT